MDKVYLYLLLFLFMNNSFPQVPILYYDFESNANRNTFENVVEQSINSGSSPLVRAGSGIIGSGYGDNGSGKALWGYNWQNVTTDPGVNATEYYQFTVNTHGFKGITIRFRHVTPYNYSPGSMGCNFSSNGTIYKSAGINGTGAPNSNWSDAAMELYNFPEVNNNPNLIIRIYAYKGMSSNSNGLLAIDNLIVTADTIISGAGEIALLNETDFYNSYYSGGTTNTFYTWKKNLVMNGPGTVVTIVSPVNFAQKLIVNDGCTLQCGIYPVWGTCSFTLNKGGTIYFGDKDGISSGIDSVGNICVKGTRIYNSGAGYYYNGLSAQVTGNGLPSSVNILGINNNCGVSLSNSVLVLDTMKLLTGNLILGNNDLTINDTAIVAGGSSVSYVVTDNSGGMVFNKMAQKTDVKLPGGTTNSYNPVIINYTGLSDTFKVKVKGAIDFALTNPNNMVNRQWTITENTSGGSDATVKLGWIQGQEAPGFNVNSDIVMGRWDGASWNQTHALISGLGTPEDPYIASAPGFTNFSYFGLGNDGALPVELTFFSYLLNGRELKLNWETATEKNSNKFDIERKEPNKDNWEQRGSIKANLMSNSTKYYSFSESNLGPGKYFYRLRMNDNNGSFQYSNIVEVEIKLPKRFTLLQNYPNPFNPSTRISYELPADAHVHLEVFNVKGERVCSLVNEFRKAGFYEVEFKPWDKGVKISSGIYFYRMNTITVNGSKLSMVKKMLYVK